MRARLRALATLTAAALLLVATPAVHAAGTRAGTAISNQVSVTFTIDLQGQEMKQQAQFRLVKEDGHWRLDSGPGR